MFESNENIANYISRRAGNIFLFSGFLNNLHYG